MYGSVRRSNYMQPMGLAVSVGVGSQGLEVDLDEHLGVMWETVADAVPDAIAVVQGERRVSWADYEQRAGRLARACLDAGLDVQSKVGIYLYNSPEYCEANFAAMKFGGVPINVNYRYLDAELEYLLDDADVEALVFHSSLAERVDRVRARLPQLKLLVQVDDGPSPGGSRLVTGAVAYSEIQQSLEPAARITPSGDERYMFYTGGTTGMPKGVVYSMSDFAAFFRHSYPTILGFPPIESPERVGRRAAELHMLGTAPVAMPGPPLMHGTGCWFGLIGPHTMGGTSVLLESRGLDPIEVWDTVEREAVQQLVIVGDAFAKPLLRALDAEPDRWDLSCLRGLTSSGAMFSTEVKLSLIEHLHGLTVADMLGSTEGSMGRSVMTRDSAATDTAKFEIDPTTKVFDENGREVEPGSGQVGVVATCGGLLPIGYYKDPEKTARTFREIGGTRFSFPGDMATVETDGTITLLGRGSSCINTGGEKVFPEEVEEALKAHVSVEDALVFGVPDDRFGNRVVGVASLSPGETATAEEVLEHTKLRLASFKLPMDFRIVASVPRAPNGKADYPAARTLFEARPK